MYQELDRNWELTTTYTSEIILDIGSLQDVFAPPALNDEALDSAIWFSTLAAICEVLHCQPGDILEYDPEPAEEK